MIQPQGLDISVYQATTPDLTNYDFCFVRATVGNVNDPDWALHSADVLRAGKVLGAYEFGVNGLTGTQQANLFLARVAGATKLVALDVEGGTQPTPQQAADWVATCRAAGNTAGIYHSVSGFPNVGEDFRWVAYWVPQAPPIPYDFWQFRGSPLDLDVFNGTLAQLYALAKLPPPDTSTGDTVDLTLIKGEDWTPTLIRRPVRATPDRSAGVVLGYIEAGVTVRTIGEATTTDGNVWRLTEFGGKPGWLLRSDFTPLVQGGDPVVDAGLHDYIARKPDPTPYSQADVTKASSSGFNAGRQAVLDAGAAVPVKQ